MYCQVPARQDAQARIAAAVLAGGPAAVASHASAGWLWGFVKHWQPPAEISLPTGDRRPRHILTHRCPSLPPRDVTHQRGVPTTSPARTALDIAPRLTAKQLTRLVNDQLRGHDLPMPQTNIRLHGRKVDAFYPEANLVVELDGRSYHSDADAFEDDRDRDAENLKHGLATMRMTTNRLRLTPEYEAKRLMEIRRARAGGS